MLGVTTEKGRIVSGGSALIYFILTTLSNSLIAIPSVIILLITGITMVLASIYYGLQKQLSLIWGIPTWILGLLLVLFWIYSWLF
ncbi:hypothetical protein [Alkaliphilus transvaalensis]|uniref:hypothetical protein n=1 Tax=Alkaliphilus transvaalensis TaxID=114628 RepID=UPI00047CC944|nr:hypothetical protein [Alkaliphilus transvaalensis]